MAKNDASKPTYYLDSCVLIDLIEHPASEEPAKTIYSIIADAEKGRFDLVTSTLTMAEVWYVKAEVDKHAIDPEVEKKINQLWHPISSPIRIVEVHEGITRDALRLLRDSIFKGWGKTKGVDAVHLITAHREGATEFFTSGERAMRKWESSFGFKICRPHYEPDPQEGFTDMFALPAPVAKPPAPASSAPVDDVFWLWRASKNRQLQSRRFVGSPKHMRRQ